jgi:hypothetical protein
MLIRKRSTGDRATPECTGCKQKGEVSCTYWGIRIHQSAYSSKTRSSRIPSYERHHHENRDSSRSHANSTVSPPSASILSPSVGRSSEVGIPSLAVTPQGQSSLPSETATNPLGQNAEQRMSVTSLLSAAPAQSPDEQQIPMVITDNVDRIVFEFYLKHIGHWVSSPAWDKVTYHREQVEIGSRLRHTTTT